MGSSDSIDELTNLLDDGSNAAAPSFAKTTFDGSSKLQEEERDVEREEVLSWFKSIEVSCLEIKDLLKFIQDHDLETAVQLVQGFDRAAAAQDAATCADILYRRCVLICENTQPSISVGEFKEMSDRAMEVSLETREQSSALVTAEFHVVFC